MGIKQERAPKFWRSSWSLSPSPSCCGALDDLLGNVVHVLILQLRNQEIEGTSHSQQREASKYYASATLSCLPIATYYCPSCPSATRSCFRSRINMPQGHWATLPGLDPCGGTRRRCMSLILGTNYSTPCLPCDALDGPHAGHKDSTLPPLSLAAVSMRCHPDPQRSQIMPQRARPLYFRLWCAGFTPAFGPPVPRSASAAVC